MLLLVGCAEKPAPPAVHFLGQREPFLILEAPRERARIPYSPTFLQQVRAGNLKSISSKGATIQGELRHRLRYPADAKVSFPAGIFTNGSKTLHSSQYGGSHSRRDIPRFVRLIEKGLFDAKSLVTSVYSLDQIKEAHQETVDRTGIAGVITFA